MDYELDPCKFCGCSQIRMSSLFEGSAVAARCQACGARGPLRMVLCKEDKGAAAALAADDWNAATEPLTVSIEPSVDIKRLIDSALESGAIGIATYADVLVALAENDQESTESPATVSPDDREADAGVFSPGDPGAGQKVAVETAENPQQASEPAGGGGGEDATQNTSKQESSVAEPEAAAPGDNSTSAAGQPPQDSDSSASDPGGAPDEIDKHELGSRVAKILKQEKLTQKAFGEMAGVHSTSVSCLVRGVYVGPGDLKKIHAFVDSWDRGYDESKVEKLKTTWPDDPGVNKLPKHSPPPRLPGAR